MKKIAAVLALAAGVFLSAGAMAMPVVFPLNQTTLGEEFKAEVHCDVVGCPVTTRNFDITNLTGVPWTNYQIRIAPVTPDGSPPFISSLVLIIPTGDSPPYFVGEQGNMFFTGNPLPPNGVLHLTLVVTEADGTVEPYDVFGQPNVPEPASLVLLGGGLLGLAAARRRRAQ